MTTTSKVVEKQINKNQDNKSAKQKKPPLHMIKVELPYEASTKYRSEIEKIMYSQAQEIYEHLREKSIDKGRGGKIDRDEFYDQLDFIGYELCGLVRAHILENFGEIIETRCKKELNKYEGVCAGDAVRLVNQTVNGFLIETIEKNTTANTLRFCF